MTYLPPRVPLTPKQAEAQRVQKIATAFRVLLWIIIALPLVFTVLAFGYSDQAPAGLRGAAMVIDGWLGKPVWALIGPKS
jgi:hypothetical protein